MQLQQARRYADHLAKWIEPYCHRVEIAGSVRRRRATCGDIDLVCIPKVEAAPRDLLGAQTEPPKSLMREFLMDYVAKSEGKAWFRSNAGVPGYKGDFVNPDAVNFLMQLPKCELDVYAATAATFATRWLIRTGSREHNIWIAERAKALGGHLDPQRGLEMGGKVIEAMSEEELYAALNLPFIPPEEREMPGLARRFPL